MQAIEAEYQLFKQFTLDKIIRPSEALNQKLSCYDDKHLAFISTDFADEVVRRNLNEFDFLPANGRYDLERNLSRQGLARMDLEKLEQHCIALMNQVDTRFQSDRRGRLHPDIAGVVYSRNRRIPPPPKGIDQSNLVYQNNELQTQLKQKNDEIVQLFVNQSKFKELELLYLKLNHKYVLVEKEATFWKNEYETLKARFLGYSESKVDDSLLGSIAPPKIVHPNSENLDFVSHVTNTSNQINPTVHIPNKSVIDDTLQDTNEQQKTVDKLDSMTIKPFEVSRKPVAKLLVPEMTPIPGVPTSPRRNSNIDPITDGIKSDSVIFPLSHVNGYNDSINSFLDLALKGDDLKDILNACKNVLGCSKQITEDCEAFEIQAELEEEDKEAIDTMKQNIFDSSKSFMQVTKEAVTMDISDDIFKCIKDATTELTEALVILITRLNGMISTESGLESSEFPKETKNSELIQRSLGDPKLPITSQDILLPSVALDSYNLLDDNDLRITMNKIETEFL
jgi:hypothetical protein